MTKLSSHPRSDKHYFRDRSGVQDNTVDSSATVATITNYLHTDIQHYAISYTILFSSNVQELKVFVVSLIGKSLRNFATTVQGYWLPLLNLNVQKKYKSNGKL